MVAGYKSSDHALTIAASGLALTIPILVKSRRFLLVLVVAFMNRIHYLCSAAGTGHTR